MKRLIVLAITVLLAEIARADIRWLETTYNFGTFDENMGKVSCDMRFVNEGDKGVIIEAVRPTCGCTAGNYSKNEIHPGDTAHITLSYNPFGRPGKFSKDVYVMVNTNPHRSKLTVKGNVIGSANTISNQYPYEVGNMKFNRKIIPYGEIKKGAVPMQLLKAYNESRDSMLVSFENLPPYINAISVPQRVGAGDLCAISMYYDSSRQNGWGYQKTKFDVVITDLRTGISVKSPVEISAIIAEDFSKMTDKEISEAPVARFSTKKVEFPEMSRGKKAESFFEITNDGKTPLLIRRIYYVDKALEVSPKGGKVDPGKTMKIKVEVNPSLIEEDVMISKIMVITNSPENAMTTVRVAGEIRK